MIRFGSDFSGVGAANQALIRLGIDYKEVFACDMDKFARRVFIHNYGEPEYFPENVYNRAVPNEPLDLFVSSPPCQAFSLAGERGGENDERGILFYNTHEFIKVNKPKFFVIENVKGLLSIDNGQVFARWIDFLGGKSVNKAVTMFPHEESVPYHIYWQVLNAKNYGVPQNRERVFIVGIRDGEDNNFRFPKPIKLKKRLKDVLEKDVDEKYYLSETMISLFNKRIDISKGYEFKPTFGESHANTVVCKTGNYSTDNYIKVKSVTKKHKIRKLTPRECFRLMDFPDSFDFSVVSDTQAYRQAGNSVVVKMYELIFKNLFEKSLQV